jgi:hypothetical protein
MRISRNLISFSLTLTEEGFGDDLNISLRTGVILKNRGGSSHINTLAYRIFSLKRPCHYNGYVLNICMRVCFSLL